MTLRCLGALLLVLAFQAPLFGQDKVWPVGRGPSREPIPYVFDRTALKNVPADFLADYPACYINAATSYRIDADGTVEATTHEVIRLNNRKGIDLVGEHRNVTFNPAYEKLTLNEARVVKSDGRTVAVESRDVQLRDVMTDYSVYDAGKELVISFPGLEIGDVIEVKWTTRGRNPEYLGQFFTRYQFGEDKCPIWKETFAAVVPKEKPLKYAPINPQLLPNVKKLPEITEENGNKLFVWRAGERRPIVKEDHLPSKEELRPGVAISTFRSWDEVADWERKIRIGCEECTPEVKEIVRQVKSMHKAPTAIARELTFWVRANIRYCSKGDRHDFTPHAPALVCKNRFGDCKDGTQLLWLLLKEAGIPSGFVSLSPLGDGQILRDVPCPWSTHAALFVSIEGTDHWIDTTAATAGWDFLPYSDRYRLAYIVDEKSFRIARTPKFMPSDNRTSTVTQIVLAADGTGHNTRTVEYFGEAAMLKRAEWLDVSARERRRLIRGELLDSFSKVKLAEPIDIDEKAIRQLDGPVKLQIKYDIPKQVHGSGDMQGSISDSTLWSPLLSVTIDPEREEPIELKEPFESKHRFIIEAPKGFMFDDPPEEQEIRSKWGSFTLQFKEDKKGRRWTIDMNTRLEKTRIDKVEFEEFRAFQEQVQTASHVDVFLKAQGDN